MRQLAAPHTASFKFEIGEHKFHRPITPFYFGVVLQRWEHDGDHRPKVPWIVEVVEDEDALIGGTVYRLVVSRRGLDRDVVPSWMLRCDDITDARRLIPEFQKALRFAFRLRPSDACSDEVFFHDLFQVCGSYPF